MASKRLRTIQATLPVIGTGSSLDPYRPKIPGINWNSWKDLSNKNYALTDDLTMLVEVTLPEQDIVLFKLIQELNLKFYS